MQLTKKDIEILIEGLSAWENIDSIAGLMADVVSLSMMKSEEDRKKYMQNRDQRKMDENKERINKSEISTMIKAKLILMKQSAKDDDIYTTFSRGEHAEL